MNEGDSFAFGADSRALVNQLDPVRAASIERGVEVVDGETHVMNA